MRPISSTAKLLLNKEESTTVPKMLAEVVMDDIAVLISRQQVIYKFEQLLPKGQFNTIELPELEF